MAVLESKVGGQRRIEAAVVAADVEAGADERGDWEGRARVGVELSADVKGWVDDAVVADLYKGINLQQCGRY